MQLQRTFARWLQLAFWAAMMVLALSPTAAKAEPALEWGVCPQTHEQQVWGDWKTPWCYQKCPAGFEGVGPACHLKKCPAGTKDLLDLTCVSYSVPNNVCPSGTEMLGTPSLCYDRCRPGTARFTQMAVAGWAFPNPTGHSFGCNSACPSGTWVADAFSCWKPEVRISWSCRWFVCWPSSFSVNVRSGRNWHWSAQQLPSSTCPANYSPVVPGLGLAGCQRIISKVEPRPGIHGIPAQICPSDYAKNPHYPIVLVDGLLGWDTLNLGSLPINYFGGFVKALENSGATVEVVVLSAANSTEVRGEQLAEQVKQIINKYGKNRVHLVGHSHGGPTARYVGGKFPEMVASVTTIAGVNYGTHLADLLATINGSDVGIVTTPALQQTFAGISQLLAKLSGADFSKLPANAIAAQNSLSHSGAKKFNEKFPWGLPGAGGSLASPLGYVHKGDVSHPQVWYSWGGAQPFSNVGPVSAVWSVIDGIVFKAPFNVRSDGAVEVNSTSYGRNLGIYEMDHHGLVNLTEINFGLLWGKAHPVTLFCEHANRLKRAETELLKLDSQGRAPALQKVATHANGVPLVAPSINTTGAATQMVPPAKAWQWQCHDSVKPSNRHIAFRLNDQSRAECLSGDGKTCLGLPTREECVATAYRHATTPLKVLSETTTTTLGSSFQGSQAILIAQQAQAWGQIRAHLSDWKCSGNVNTPVRRNEAGDMQCLSKDGRNCQWHTSIDTCHKLVEEGKKGLPLSPVTCGESLKSTQGILGYDQPGHWCERAKTFH